MISDKKILLVEDSRVMATMIKRELETSLGIKVDHAADLDQCNKFLALRRHQYSLALVDLTLPDAPDGEVVGLCHEKQIPSIVFSGTRDEALRTELFGAGVIDFVVKDTKASTGYLVRLVRQLLRNENRKALVATSRDRNFHHILIEKLMFGVKFADKPQDILTALNGDDNIKVLFVGPELVDCSALDLIRTVRKNFSRERLTIIALPGDNRTLATQLVKNGADDYIPEPTTPEEFYCRVNSAMETADLMRELETAATRDFLTGCRNRRSFFSMSKPLFSQVARKAATACVAMVDIDKFKSINDTYGHDVGDDVIKTLGAYLMSHVRATDIVARFGGEEFCVLLVNPDPKSISQCFEKLRTGVGVLEVPVYEGEASIKFTVSIGVCDQIQDEFEDMIKMADEQLYHAKQKGRNRVEVLSEAC